MRTLDCFTFEPLGEDDIEDKSFTISYSLDMKGWVAQHDYIPDNILYTANRLVSFRDGTVMLHNAKGVKGKYYGDTIHPSYIEPVVTDILTKLYGSVLWKTQVYENGMPNQKKTLTSIMLYTETRCSGEVPVTYMKTTRNAEGLWKFNNFRDVVKDATQKFLDDKGQLVMENIDLKKPFFRKSKLYGDYLCVRLIFDNLEQTDLVLSDMQINNRISPR